MATYRNAFLSRFSDRSGLSNAQFLTMYAPQFVRELLKNENMLLQKTTWMLGIPGSGKSTILRLFTIDILLDVIRQKSIYTHLYSALSDIGIIEDDVVKTVGIYIAIDEVLAETANVNLSGVDRDRLLYTLFDLRVAKQLMHAKEKIASLNGKNGKEEIIKGVSSERMPPKIFSENKSVAALESEILQKEALASKVLNSFPGTPLPENLELHGRFSSFDLIDFQLHESSVGYILMVDDAHELYSDHLKLLSTSIEKKYQFPRWVATRKHIYPVERLLGQPGSTTEGREVIKVDLDYELRQSSLFKKFIKMLVDRRLKLTDALNEFNAEQIEAMLVSDVPITASQKPGLQKEQREDAAAIVRQIAYQIPELDEFINGKQMALEDAELLLIKAQRAIRRRQQVLFYNINMEVESASKDRQAADLFLKKRAKIPLYCGFDAILAASNNNVEQFMRIFSLFVDRLIYRVELNKERAISPNEQQSLFEKTVKDYVENIILRLHHGNKINQLVDNLGRFFSLRTYEPNAPHAPGVTQFALLASDVNDPKRLQKNGELSQILATAIAHNVIVPPERGKHQGAKDSELKYVFTLNRLLCVKYELPMQKGDFQLLPLDLLEEMCNRPFKPEEIKRRKGSQTIMWETSSDEMV